MTLRQLNKYLNWVRFDNLLKIPKGMPINVYHIKHKNNVVIRQNLIIEYFSARKEKVWFLTKSDDLYAEELVQDYNRVWLVRYSIE